MGATVEGGEQFFAEGRDVYGRHPDGTAELIASAEAGTWAQTIADAMNSDPDVYLV